ncbi:MAG: C-type lectin domain-containing protein [Deltaproteobacteria bacterium]|nr:C-type lectin domain-containing protein [Deltaproteobacteria bacterium]
MSEHGFVAAGGFASSETGLILATIDIVDVDGLNPVQETFAGARGSPAGIADDDGSITLFGGALNGIVGPDIFTIDAAGTATSTGSQGTFSFAQTGGAYAGRNMFTRNAPNQSDVDEDCVSAEAGGWDDTDCALAFPFVCEENQTAATPRCGNGVVDGSEGCDDGNVDGGDGCEADCSLLCGGPDAVAAFQLTDRCAAFFDAQLSWTSAASACFAVGSPAIFTSEADARAATPLRLLQDFGPAWVGMTQDGLVVPGATEISPLFADSSQPVFTINPLFAPGALDNDPGGFDCFLATEAGWDDDRCFNIQRSFVCTTNP